MVIPALPRTLIALSDCGAKQPCEEVDGKWQIELPGTLSIVFNGTYEGRKLNAAKNVYVMDANGFSLRKGKVKLRGY